MLSKIIILILKYSTFLAMITLIVLAVFHSDKAGIHKLGDYYESHEDPFQITIR
jgi:hypothetical protein